MVQTDAFLDEITRVSADLDRLIADRQSGARPSQTRHDGHVDQAEELAARLIRVARGPGRRPVHPPLAITAIGTVW